MRVLKFILATIGGIFAGSIFTMLVQMINYFRYPMPEGLDMNDQKAFTEYVASLPLGAFLTVIASYAVGTLVAAFVARRIAPNRSAIPSLLTCLFFMAATIMNLISIPHPAWFAWVAFVTV